MTASCPRCKKPLPIPATAGAVLCTACGTTFKVTRPHPSAVDPTNQHAKDKPPATPEEGVDDAAPSNRRALVLAAAGGAVGGAVLLLAVLLLAGWGPKRDARHESPVATSGPATAPVPQYRAVGGSVRTTSDFVSAAVEVSASAVPSRVAVAASPPAPAATQPVTQPTTRPADPPAAVAAVPLARPALQPTPIPSPDRVTDRAIEESIRRGVDLLIKEFDPKTGTLKHVGRKPDALACGLNALCVYALMQAGLATGDPRIAPQSEFMRTLVDGMRTLPAGEGYTQTYARGLRAAALAASGNPADRGRLAEDVGCLLHGHVNGAYSYGTARQVGSDTFQFDPPTWLDNSNSQYGLLGVWSGAEAGLEIPAKYWEQVTDHWTNSQDTAGTWGYHVTRGGTGVPGGQKPPRGHSGITRTPLAMTAAGLASTLVARDHLLLARRDATVGLDPYPRPIGPALEWFERGDNAIRIPALHWGYVLYGVERVGLASGLKHFGKHDWYRVLAAEAINRQLPDGGWARPDAVAPADLAAAADEQVMGDRPNTAFALLFLSRGRHPVVMNKLRYDGPWANRPRDLAGLTRFVGRQLERQVNWQVVDLRREWQEWTDAPVLTVSGHEPPQKFTDADYLKLRAFVLAGGLIFTQADGDSTAFTRWVEREFGPKVLPGYEYRDVPGDHPLYRSLFPMTIRPPLRAMSNGSRLLLVHSPKDLSIGWQFRDEQFRRDHFEMGANLFVYAAGRRDLRNRLDSPYVPKPDGPPPTGRTLRIARLRYAGDWDPEPWAWIRYARLFQFRTGYGLDVKPVTWADLAPADAPVAHLSGTARYEPTDAEVAALRAYVEAGGVVLVDHCGGVGRFGEAARAALARAFPGRKPAPLPPTHPLLAAGPDGMADLSTPRLRPYASDLMGRNAQALEILEAGKGVVIYTKLDVTSGLLGTHTLPILGYQPQYAEALAQNLLFWTTDRAAAVGPATAPSTAPSTAPATAPATAPSP